MPGSHACARCGAVLRLAATVGVHPPRAAAWTKRAPAIRTVRRVRNRVLSRVSEPLRRALSLATFPAAMELPLKAWLIPGLGHIQRGDFSRGRAFFTTFAVLAVLATPLMGTAWGSMFLGLAFATHISSLFDLLARGAMTTRDRVYRASVIMAALSLLMYMSLGWAITRVATPVRFRQNSPPLSAGDVVWYNRLASADVGDLVVYTLPETSYRARTDQGRNAAYIHGGLRAGRVIAREGQQVEGRQGVFSVDGVAVPWPAPEGSIGAADFALTVRRGRVYVAPTDVIPRDIHVDEFPGPKVGEVPIDAVLGQAYFRSFPWTRLGVVR